MLPALVLVGRPNVGKSTLFNRLTGTRDAIVDDQPGVTRDRLYGRGQIGGEHFLAVDTGGLDDARGAFADGIRGQVASAMEDAQAILFLVDARDGLVAQDHDIAAQLRRSDARVFVLVNKSEGLAPEVAAAEFQSLGLGAPHAVSATRGDGVEHLVAQVLAEVSGTVTGDSQSSDGDDDGDDDRDTVITLAGRPNVGKSTLANRLAGEARVLVSDTPGTTRDSVRVPLDFDGRRVLLIDTAGVRRKSRVAETIEKFSVIKSLQAISHANVVILMVDAQTEIGVQDATIAGMIRDLGRSMLVVVNKWDRLADHRRAKIRAELERKLRFLPNAEILFVSALHGSNLAEILPAAMRAYQSAMCDIATSSMNRTLERAVAQMPPPMQGRRTVRLKFAHQAGKNPPVIVVHGNLTTKLPATYRRYLANYFAREYKLVGTPIKIIMRSADNPYQPKGKGKPTRR